MDKSNALAHETSPYLQQHANNPVNWYPWNDAALTKAKNENKPILLSIGYSACHWCHVMAHESFEDEETAAIMNQHFINIKVDREERPDLDKIYQTAHYFLTHQAGGWPLTIFLSPQNLTPFFSGTYFPKTPRYQLPSFKEVLTTIADVYKNKLEDIEQQNQQLVNLLNHPTVEAKNIVLSLQPLTHALTQLQNSYDKEYGGFNGAPKFPNPAKLELLLHIHSPLAEYTLNKMAQGGIYDQIEGGFFRYSVDRQWEIPHFEKMLYDNAQLVALYALAGKQQIARETAEWVIETMQSPEGGFYSSLDADSEGHEGKYYVWNKFQILETLTPKEAEFIELYLNVGDVANFEKQWHLHVKNSLEDVSQQLKITIDEAQQLFNSSKQKLQMIRAQRIKPFQDKKILTSWNSLMIKGLLIAGEKTKEPSYIQAAKHALQFLKTNLWQNEKLLVSYKDGRAHLSAYLDDYAYLLDALLYSLQISWDTATYHWALQLAEYLLQHFYDSEHGGFFFTADDQEKILYRPKSMMDEVTPSGNAIATQALLVLGYLLGETRYLDAVEHTLKQAWPALQNYPAEHCGLLLALEAFLQPQPIIVIRGEQNEMKHWQDYCKQQVPQAYTLAIPNTEKLPGLLQHKETKDKTIAYICRGMQCEHVIEDFEKLKQRIEHLS